MISHPQTKPDGRKQRYAFLAVCCIPAIVGNNNLNLINANGLVFDAHKDEVEILKKNIPGLMSNAIKLAVPVEVEVGLGKDWLEAH